MYNASISLFLIIFIITSTFSSSLNWLVHSSMNLPLPLSNSAVYSYNNSLYIFGGRALNGSAIIPLDKCYKYSFQNNKWINLPDLEEPRYGHGVYFLGNFVYILGGISKFKNETDNTNGLRYLSSIEKYSLVEEKFIPFEKALPIPLARFAVVNPLQKNEKKRSSPAGMYIIGGVSDGLYQNLIYYYDLVDFANVGVLPFPLCDMKAMYRPNELVVFGGGRDRNDVISNVYRYDLSTYEWKISNFSLNVPRRDFAKVFMGDFLYILGGYYFDEKNGKIHVDQIERISSTIDPETKKINEDWEIDSTNVIARSGAVAVMFDGEIFLVGGQSTDSDALDSVEVGFVKENGFPFDYLMMYLISAAVIGTIALVLLLLICIFCLTCIVMDSKSPKKEYKVIN